VEGKNGRDLCSKVSFMSRCNMPSKFSGENTKEQMEIVLVHVHYVHVHVFRLVRWKGKARNSQCNYMSIELVQQLI
jgi:hypothetical protein